MSATGRDARAQSATADREIVGGSHRSPLCPLPDACEHGPVLHHHVVVTGTAGAGKSTLTTPLAATLGAVLLSKDQIKEALHEAMPATTPSESLRLSAAAMGVVYHLARECGPGLVMDANWRVGVDVTLLEGLPRPLVQVFCEVVPALAQRRLVARVRSGERHPVHRDMMDRHVLMTMVQQAGEPSRPLPIKGPLLRVDTSGAVDVAAVARWILAQ